MLVTGGAGFIGSHLVDRLISNGCKVVVLDDLCSGGKENIEDHLVERRVQFLEGSILDGKAVERAMQGVDAVVHLAAIVSVPFSSSNPKLTHEVNVDGTRLLMDQCAANHVERFILVSSCAVYGEPQYVPTDEMHPENPLSTYAESKLEAERTCIEESELDDLERIVLRLFNVYGSRQADNGYASVISSFTESLNGGMPLTIYGDGLQTRDFVHVSDVVEAIWLALTTVEAEGILNVASGRSIEIRELAELMIELAGVDSSLAFEKPRNGDIHHSHGDYTRAWKMLGYRPETKLEDGLTKLLENADDPLEARVVREVAVL
ncbi:MAG: NAD-dependent epimerase/dehydratase family protein [Candidatus Bathyarchaeota archaeon]|nr:NAD-dependent epimerase/dehydratase family protein [Candidatus Bathyarchaeota archaeon]